MSLPFALGIIADDLTGGAESAVAMGQGPLLFFHEAAARIDLADEDVWALSTTSRPLPPREAAQRSRTVARALHNNPSLRNKPRFFKKVDSLLRGNIGAETDGFLDGADLAFSLIAPAHPLNGRTTRNDIHYVDDIPVARTEAGRDPVTPVVTSSLSRIMAAQSPWPVVSIGTELLDGTFESLVDRIGSLTGNGRIHIVFDITEPGHLDTVARLALEAFPASLPVGSGGLAQALARHGAFTTAERAGEPVCLPVAAPLLMALGSASPAACRQVEALQSAHPCRLIEITPQSLSDASASSRLAELSCHDRTIDIIRLSPPDTTLHTSDARVVAEKFGCLIAEHIRKNRPGALYVSGGDTAVSTFTALDGLAIRILDEVTTGLVRGRIIGGAAKGMPICTKPGSFGADDALVRLADSFACERPCPCR